MVIASRAAVTRYAVGEEVYGWLLHDSQQSKQHAHPRIQAESSNTANPPAPRPEPACRTESKSSGTSRLLWNDDGVGGAGEDRLDRPAGWRAAGQLLYQVAQRRAERQLEHPFPP
jgi:hypothetical protein